MIFVAQRSARRRAKAEVVGSNPTEDTVFVEQESFLFYHSMRERATAAWQFHKLHLMGSTPILATKKRRVEKRRHYEAFTQ